jgi:poly-gamma-glutamate capsule biosynthesis protein CapA/YwtB (metallophosphatase superfamily)
VRLLALVLRAGAVVVAVGALAVVLDGPESRTFSAEDVSVPDTPAAETVPETVAAGPAATPAPPGVVTVVAVGSILPGGPALLADVESELGGDVVTGALDGTLDGGAGPHRGRPSFAGRLHDAGLTVVSLATPHAYDDGPPGLRRTATALADAGVEPTGRPGEVAVHDAGRVTVAVVGFGPFPWAQRPGDLAGARELVGRAGARADLVVAVVCGVEDDRAFRTLARTVIDAGGDLVVGAGGSRLGSLEWYRGRLVARSLGTVAGRPVTPVPSVAAVLRVSLRRDGRFEGGLVVPVARDGAGRPTVDAAGTAIAALAERSRADAGPRAAVPSAEGLITGP